MSYQNHPGHEAECFLKIRVTDQRTDGAKGGYACGVTGGHCLPVAAKCSAFQTQALREIAEFQRLTREQVA